MNKTIVITGGSDGLGKTLAESLSKDNNVIIIATNEEKLKLQESKQQLTLTTPQNS